MIEKLFKKDEHRRLEMFFLPEVARKFAELEQNDKNFQVAQIVDQIIMEEIKNFPNPIYVAELGGGAHPDRYHEFFERLLREPRSKIDWVDVSPIMLELADEYISGQEYEARKEVINFIEKDVYKYLEELEDEKLDLAIMKYTINDLEDLDLLFSLFSEKIKKTGKVIATIGALDGELKSHSTNARYLHNGEEFGDDEIHVLDDGDEYTIKFFKVSGDPSSGYTEGAVTTKYFHSTDKIKKLASEHGFDVFLGDWKNFIKEQNQKGEKLDQDILVLTKK